MNAHDSSRASSRRRNGLKSNTRCAGRIASFRFQISNMAIVSNEQLIIAVNRSDQAWDNNSLTAPSMKENSKHQFLIRRIRYRWQGFQPYPPSRGCDTSAEDDIAVCGML